LILVAGGFGNVSGEGARAASSQILYVPAKTVEQAKIRPAQSPHVYVSALASSLAAILPETEEIISVPDMPIVEDGGRSVALSYKEVSVYVDGVDVGTAMHIGESVYVPVADFCEAIGYPVTAAWDAEDSTAYFTGAGLELSVRAGDSWITANGRVLHTDRIYNVNGTMVAPVRELAQCFGVSVSWSESDVAVYLDTSEMAPLVPAAAFYDEEDLYWLSHLIFAEAGNQPLEGMVGVGNVVLNRVQDPTCPDTVYDVIFDSRYGVQFSVTETGSIYLEPTEEAVQAAKMCLEGYNCVGDSLYFVNPEIGISSWFTATRTYVATIGDHVFFA
jgi:N-acetylmuramoyl-L-alanine amidase